METSVRAFGKYNRTKKMASSESLKRSREFIETMENMQCHPLFAHANNISDIQMEFRKILKQERPKRTIFETTHGRNENACSALLNLRKMKEMKDYLHVKNRIVVEKDDFLSSKCKTDKPINKYVVPNLTGPDATESGLSLQNSGFALEAKEAVLEFQNDELNSNVHAVGAKRQRMTWDRKRKRFVGEKNDKNSKKIRTESGAVISASYKTDAYARWLKTSNTGMVTAKTVSFEDEENNDVKSTTKKAVGKQNKSNKSFTLLNNRGSRFKNQSQTLTTKDCGKTGRQLKPEQIIKRCKEKEKVKKFQKSRQLIHKKKKRN